MGEIDAAGEIVTGALLGRALEPRAGEGEAGAHDAICLNCGTALIGPHCHRCGQSGHVHRSLGAIGHEILHGVAHFEGKLWRTLPLLAWRPGELTRRYVEGERARFVSPMALFLFSVFTMFAVFSIVGISTPADLAPTTQLVSGFQSAREKAVAQRKELQEDRAERAARNPADPKLARIDADLAEIDQSVGAIDRAAAEFARAGVSDREVRIGHTGIHAIDHGLEKWQKNPSLMLYKLQSSSYKFSWLLIPLSLPFLWLLFFWKRRYKLYDHTVFITYSIAFMSLLFVAVTILGSLGADPGWLVLLGVWVPFLHIWRQLQQAYGLRWYSALIRAVVLSLMIVILIAPLFVTALLLLGMFG